MDASEWLTRFAERLGVDLPEPAVIEDLLALVGDAAHSSERLAAPIACYIVGRAGIDATAARALAAEIA